MKTELLIRGLLALTIASTLSILVTLTIRRVVRLLFGAAAAYCTWLLVPASLLAALLPNPPNSVAAIRIFLRIDPVSALERSVGSSFHTAPSLDWTLWAAGIWAVGTALFVLYFAGLQRTFVNSLGAMSGSRCVLRAERPVGCPALLGVFRPKVILPRDFKSRYTRLERLLIFSHERTHLRRGDAVWNALVALLRCLLWFNPLVHVASTRLREDQELSCDAAVVEDHRGSRRAYATAMLKTQLADVALPIGCHWHSTEHLKERLQMLKKATPSRWRRASGHILVALASLAVGYGVWAAEPDATLSASASTLPEIRGSRLTIMLNPGPGAPVTINADRASVGPNVEETTPVTLEGHVRIKASASAVHGSSSEQGMASELGNVLIEADRIVMTKQADGRELLEIENGSIRQL